jgi:uncharacterized membrane protein
VRTHRLADVGPLAGSATQFAWLDLAAQPSFAPPSISHENTLGLNDDGILVGGFVASGSPPIVHAFVWLPRAQHGLPAGLTDLHAAVWSTGTDSSWAGDVNEAGVVAGQKGADIAASCHAHVWTLASTITAADLHTTSGAFSAATAINDEPIPRVAGQTTDLCPVEDSALPFIFSGFHRTVDSLDAMSLLGSLGDSPVALASGLRRTAPLRIVGADLAELSDPENPCYIDPIATSACSYPENDAIAWTVTSGGTAALDLEGLSTTLPGVDDQGAMAADINESGDVVGLGWDIVSGAVISCVPHAAGWFDGTPGPHDLAAEFSPVLSSRAHAVTDRDELGCVTVVGRSLEGDDGLIWYGSGTSWCAGRLSELVLDPSCVDVGGRTLLSAHDVNNHRVVAVVYSRPVSPPATGNEYRAGIITDAADLTGDLRIDTSDRAILMAAYCGGGLPGCVGKPEADLNCDGVVDAVDMAIMSARWTGFSGIVTLPPLCECSEEESMALSAPFDELVAATEAIAELGFDLEEFSNWLKTASESDADIACQFVADTVTLKKGGA